eukprot:3616185-Prymnesium_polylepis.1
MCIRDSTNTTQPDNQRTESTHQNNLLLLLLLQNTETTQTLSRVCLSRVTCVRSSACPLGDTPDTHRRRAAKPGAQNTHGVPIEDRCASSRAGRPGAI